MKVDDVKVVKATMHYAHTDGMTCNLYLVVGYVPVVGYRITRSFVVPLCDETVLMTS